MYERRVVCHHIRDPRQWRFNLSPIPNRPGKTGFYWVTPDSIQGLYEKDDSIEILTKTLTNRKDDLLDLINLWKAGNKTMDEKAKEKGKKYRDDIKDLKERIRHVKININRVSGQNVVYDQAVPQHPPVLQQPVSPQQTPPLIGTPLPAVPVGGPPVSPLPVAQAESFRRPTKVLFTDLDDTLTINHREGDSFINYLDTFDERDMIHLIETDGKKYKTTHHIINFLKWCNRNNVDIWIISTGAAVQTPGLTVTHNIQMNLLRYANGGVGPGDPWPEIYEKDTIHMLADESDDKRTEKYWEPNTATKWDGIEYIMEKYYQGQIDKMLFIDDEIDEQGGYSSDKKKPTTLSTLEVGMIYQPPKICSIKMRIEGEEPFIQDGKKLIGQVQILNIKKFFGEEEGYGQQPMAEAQGYGQPGPGQMGYAPRSAAAQTQPQGAQPVYTGWAGRSGEVRPMNQAPYGPWMDRQRGYPGGVPAYTPSHLAAQERANAEDRALELVQARERIEARGGIGSVFKSEHNVQKLEGKIKTNTQTLELLKEEGEKKEGEGDILWMFSEEARDVFARNVLLEKRIADIKQLSQAPEVQQPEIPKETQHTFLDHAKSHRWDKVMQMVELNPNIINVQPSGRMSALHQAVLFKNLEMVEWLLKRRADKNSKYKEKSVIENALYDDMRSLLERYE